MKSQFKKVAAVTLAMAMCLPSLAFAEEDRATIDSATRTGSFDTSFDLYAPPITVSVPLKADIRINPLAEDATNAADTTVKNLTVASNSIDIWNSSVDEDGNGVPVNVMVNATVTNASEGVVQLWNDFSPDLSSTQKKIHLELAEASTAATADGNTAAIYNPNVASPNNATITRFGSQLSVDIGKPDNSDPVKVGSFAVIGKANVNADWKADDIAVNITYKIKASKALGIKTPKVSEVVATPGTEKTFTIDNVGEATVLPGGVSAHNEEPGLYDLAALDFEATTANGVATVTIPADDAVVKGLHDNPACAGIPQDLIIALSDGRMVVTTIKVN